MENNDKQLKRNASLLYGVIITLGILLSAFVYYSTQKVNSSTTALVESEIPIFSKLQQLESALVEQELFLNEYYATQNRELYTSNFKQVTAEVETILNSLNQQQASPELIELLQIAQQQIVSLAVEFDQNMGREFSNEKWDLAREHLESFSMYRQATTPIIKDIIGAVNNRVQTGYAQTQENLTQTSYTVLFYSLMILLIAVVIGRYIKTYVLISAQSKRLALFPQHNPNPILSFTEENEISYFNPATNKLIDELAMSLDEFTQHILPSITQTQQQIIDKNEHHSRFEFVLNNKVLECELHRLIAQHAWDIHIVDITMRKKAEDKLNYQAFHVVETGLYNKNKFHKNIQLYAKQEQHFAIGSMELRHYNQLVSKLGLEQAGEIVLDLAKRLTELFEQCLQDTQYSFYQTSEKQFSLIIPTDFCDVKIQNLVDKIETTIELNSFCNNTHIELDFGFCCFPDHAADPTSIIKCINIALDHAISIDHSSLVIYSQNLGDEITKEMELTEQLRHAIDEQKLELYFQPQQNIQMNKVVGLETLIRWPTENGFISPVEFIPLAEKSGLIIPLGQWIAEQACLFAKQLVDLGYVDIVVAINISPQQFKHPAFYDMILGALSLTQVPPRNIELEITEGVIMYNESDTIELLKKLKDLGLQLSIDDFGTGYSSLSYLKQFPIDKLKIDQSFIKHIEQNHADKAIVNTIVDLGKNLNLTLIAEGVEESSHLSILKQMGCHEIQGYYFSRPLPKQQLLDFISESAIYQEEQA